MLWLCFLLSLLFSDFTPLLSNYIYFCLLTVLHLALLSFCSHLWQCAYLRPAPSLLSSFVLISAVINNFTFLSFAASLLLSLTLLDEVRLNIYKMLKYLWSVCEHKDILKFITNTLSVCGLPPYLCSVGSVCLQKYHQVNHLCDNSNVKNTSRKPDENTDETLEAWMTEYFSDYKLSFVTSTTLKLLQNYIPAYLAGWCPAELETFTNDSPSFCLCLDRHAQLLLVSNLCWARSVQG